MTAQPDYREEAINAMNDEDDIDAIEDALPEDGVDNYSGMETMDYREISRVLTSEGYATEDIDAAINSLIESGITYADEDELLLTKEEVGVVRDQLKATADD